MSLFVISCMNERDLVAVLSPHVRKFVCTEPGSSSSNLHCHSLTLTLTWPSQRVAANGVTLPGPLDKLRNR